MRHGIREQGPCDVYGGRPPDLASPARAPQPRMTSPRPVSLQPRPLGSSPCPASPTWPASLCGDSGNASKRARQPAGPRARQPRDRREAGHRRPGRLGALGLDELAFQGQQVPDPAPGLDVGDGFQHADHGQVRGLLGDDGGLGRLLPRHAIWRICCRDGQGVLPCGPHDVADGGRGDLADGGLDRRLGGLDAVRGGSRS
jgi:hypothetical protein